MRLAMPLLFLLFQACAKLGPEASCDYITNYGQRVSWKGDVPVVMDIHVSFPVEYIGAVERAMDTWNKAVGYEVFVIGNYAYSGVLEPRVDGRNVIYWMNHWKYSPTQQAFARMYYRLDKILEGDIVINNSQNYFYWNVYRRNGLDIESLLLHELGHVLGLDHMEEYDSPMYPSLDRGYNRRTLTQLELSNLKCEY